MANLQVGSHSTSRVSVSCFGGPCWDTSVLHSLLQRCDGAFGSYKPHRFKCPDRFLLADVDSCKVS